MTTPAKVGPYRLGRTIGHGTFGKVKLAEHEPTGQQVAVKILNRQRIKDQNMEAKVRREIKIMKMCMHPHVIRLLDVVYTPTDIYMVMEHVSGGELFDYIVTSGKLPEDHARKLFQQLMAGVRYCHSRSVAHRDLKPENIILDSDGDIKIADFGLSNIMRDGELLSTSCGSPNYAGPEVISGRSYGGPEVDVWSCGVILYALLCGSLPFDDENIPNLFRKIRAGQYMLPGFLSPGSRDLIPRMLRVEPCERITLDQIFQHPWFQHLLPRYLAMNPEDVSRLMRVVSPEIAHEVAQKQNCDYQQLVGSIEKGVRDELTVFYYLAKEQRMKQNRTKLFPEELYGVTTSQAAIPTQLEHSRLATTHHAVVSSCLPPHSIMFATYHVLKELQFVWKLFGPYYLKCRPSENYQGPFQSLKVAVRLYKFPTEQPRQSGERASFSGMVTDSPTYGLDFQKLDGSLLVYLDFVSQLVHLLEI